MGQAFSGKKLRQLKRRKRPATRTVTLSWVKSSDQGRAERRRVRPEKPTFRWSIPLRVIARLYVPSTNEATHPRCCDEGCPDGPGRASNKEGESWVIIPRPLSESIRQNCVMQ